MSGLELGQVSIRRAGAASPLFPALSLEVHAGEILTIMGPSGIGKSTLIDFIGGHLDAGFDASGKVILNGVDVTGRPAEARGIGILFQDAVLFPHLSVGDNLAFALDRRIAGRFERRKAVEDALASAGLRGFYERDPATLSGGQRARAALMRTLLAAPRALLLDEPFAKLDPELRQEIRSFVFEHVRIRDIPVLMVTHDPSDAEAAGGRSLAL
ncbi:ATP-binding cassette domain-containing protein [Defluviimonas sp. WL0002]|uniref:ATP-binding cassette domain-containing protein n=1 Tax=Albidovulum marisflavi TaxID=2984159 RepID=A0ABT2Z9C2_9RHOB|nr:ATP-binding cassette domain-containing protein [Defluviimonas sp. WL0002]MCV2867734.1 ATP-binding cassette domain-containing protein [Defluviimonas sp. WL0002]